MMLATGNTFSGTTSESRQSYLAYNFNYSFAPVPTTNQGGYMYSTVALGFSVNKKSKNVEMANEFMRFLISSKELNNMNEVKRMTSPCKNMSLEGMFTGFGKLRADHKFANSEVGLDNWPDNRVRKAGASIFSLVDRLTIDQAIIKYGSF